jgi:eukaryotic-like serine/threonine-protein kinase
VLSDRIITHLRDVIHLPDLSGSRYQILEEIGRGGMGVVYIARDPALGRDVALKVVNNSEEARTLAFLEHPGIVPVHDSGILADGRLFYVMKLVDGVRLDAYRASVATLEDRLRTFVRICEPVAFAHSRGVIHRDLKPENIMIGSFGEVLVLDWGIAGRLDAASKTAAGTRGYMAPEQREGITDVRTDIYSLGKVLEFLLDAKSPKAVHAIAAKASHCDTTIRYSAVAELSADVTRYLDGQGISAYRESIFEVTRRWLSSNRTLTFLIVTYLLVRAAIFFLVPR